MSNHGQVGKTLYMKFTSEKFKSKIKNGEFKHGDILSIEDLNNMPGISSSISIHIDDNTQGNYECVCEFGTEVY